MVSTEKKRYCGHRERVQLHAIGDFTDSMASLLSYRPDGSIYTSLQLHNKHTKQIHIKHINATSPPTLHRALATPPKAVAPTCSDDFPTTLPTSHAPFTSTSSLSECTFANRLKQSSPIDTERSSVPSVTRITSRSGSTLSTRCTLQRTTTSPACRRLHNSTCGMDSVRGARQRGSSEGGMRVTSFHWRRNSNEREHSGGRMRKEDRCVYWITLLRFIRLKNLIAGSDSLRLKY